MSARVLSCSHSHSGWRTDRGIHIELRESDPISGQLVYCSCLYISVTGYAQISVAHVVYENEHYVRTLNRLQRHAQCCEHRRGDTRSPYRLKCSANSPPVFLHFQTSRLDSFSSDSDSSGPNRNLGWIPGQFKLHLRSQPTFLIDWLLRRQMHLP
jgi:hypothetical protein